MEMFKPELAMAVDSSSKPPTTVADCVTRALRVEYRMTQVKEEWAQFYKAQLDERNQEKMEIRGVKEEGTVIIMGQETKVKSSPRQTIITRRDASQTETNMTTERSTEDWQWKSSSDMWKLRKESL